MYQRHQSTTTFIPHTHNYVTTVTCNSLYCATYRIEGNMETLSNLADDHKFANFYSGISFHFTIIQFSKPSIQ